MMTPKPYTWLLFDADGTLFNYNLAEAKALQAAFEQFSLPFDQHAFAQYRKINQEIWVDFENGKITASRLRVERFARLFQAIAVEASLEDFSRCYLDHLARGSDLLEGALETIRALRSRYQMAIITNGLSDVQRPRLAASGIMDCFSLVAVSEELGVAKPHARFFEIVLQRIGSPPKAELLVIGDSLTSDIQGGNNAGLDTCWYNPAGAAPDPRYPATYQIRRLPDLLDLLGA